MLGDNINNIHTGQQGSNEGGRLAVTFYDNDSGGPEALVQLYLALQDAGLKPFHVGDPHINHKSYLQEERKLELAELQPGDKILVPEITCCPCLRKQLKPGVRILMWLLADHNVDGDDDCERVSHADFLLSKGGPRLPHSMIIPYLTPGIVDGAQSMAGLTTEGEFHDLDKMMRGKEDLIIVDDDAYTIVLPYLEHLNAKVVKISGMNHQQLNVLNLRSKVVIDWCMRGLERAPLEASLFGAVLITNRCGAGASDVDIPISPHHKAANESDLGVVVRNVLADYRAAVLDQGQVALRKRYGTQINRLSMKNDVIKFLC